MLRHFDSELQELKTQILSMGGCVEKALEEVCQALFTKNSSRLQEVHKQEARINELQVGIDSSCVRLLAKQAPVAKDLRLVIAITKINTDLERMGDQAVNIAHSAGDLFSQGLSHHLPEDLSAMAEKVKAMVRDSLDAFVHRDIHASQGLLTRDDEVDELKDKIISEMIQQMRLNKDLIELSLDIIMIAKNFERLADHATNIAEEVIYLATGDDVRHSQTGATGG